MEAPPHWGIESFEEMAVHFTAFHGAGLGAIRSRAEGSAGRDYRGELWSCGSLASLDSAAAATAAAAAEASASHLETKIPPVTPSTASPGVPEAQPHEDSTDEEDMEQESATLAGRQQVPWAGFEKVFTFVRQKGKNLVVQCNCCLPAIKHLSSAINSSSNLRKHLERAHPGMLRVIRSLKKAKKRGLTGLAAAAAVAADVAAEGLSGQTKRSNSSAARNTESPNVAEAQSREDSMNEEEAEQPPPATTAQPQEPWSGTDKEAALSSENTTSVAEASASHPEARIPPIIHSGESQIVESQPHEGSAHEEETEPQSSTPASRQQDPFAGLEKAFTFVRQKGGSVLMQCNYCLPVIKNVSSAVNSATNLRKHLEKAHPEKLGAAENAGKGKKRGFFEELLDEDDDPPSIKMLKQQQQQQPTLERWGSGKEQITQKILDRKIMDFIVDETLPLHTVDHPSFVGLVRLGLPKCLTIMCSKTLRDSIEKRVVSMRERLLRRLGAVEYVATTADCWTYGKRRFLSVTAHWINPTTLEREFGALACKRLKGHHTYEALAKTLSKVYVQYKIHGKVVCMTTDNGFNFVKAFRFFEAKEPADAADASADDEDDSDRDSDDDDDDDRHDEDTEEEEEEEETEVEFVPISEMLNAGNKAKEAAENSEDFGLPPHQRCASHTLNLVATQEIQAMVADSSPDGPLGPFRKHFCSLMGKCSKLWSKQEQSEQIAEYIHKQYGVYLMVPDKTRWHSTFEALKQLSELLSSMPLKLDTIMDQCSLARITTAEALALQEYTEVMGPLAQALDILQQDNGMFMGYLLPTLYNLDRKLQGLEKEAGRYTYCLPLLKGVRRALRKRFSHIWEDKKLLLAACLHPRFKVDWLESAQNAQTNRYMMEALLKAEIRGTVEEARERSSEKDAEGASLEDDFFNIQPQGKKPTEEDSVDEEVARYLKSPSREVSLLHAFPRVMQSFLQYNTGMPSSAAIEQLFSTGGKVMTVKRHSLSDKLFEQLVLLRQNRAVF